MTDIEQVTEEIKQQLESYRGLRAEHQQLRDELQQLETLLGSPSGSNTEGGPRGSGVSNPVERKGIKHLELEKRYRAQLAQMSSAMLEIEARIAVLPTSDERRLIRYRYLAGLGWEDVCERIHYSWTQTHRIHRRALANLAAAELARREHDARNDTH